MSTNLDKIITIEEDREAKRLATDLVASDLYAVKLMDTKGCVVLRKTIATSGTGGTETE